MFGRRIFAVAALATAFAQAQLTITNPGPNSWWVADSENTLAWTCDTSTYSSYTVLVSNSASANSASPLALIANLPNYDCSFTVNQQLSSLAVSNSWTLSFANPVNETDVYASTQFAVEAAGSAYPTSSASSSGTATSSAGSASSTSSSKSNGAVANYVPVGMSMAAALMLGLVVA